MNAIKRFWRWLFPKPRVPLTPEQVHNLFHVEMPQALANARERAIHAMTQPTALGKRLGSRSADVREETK